MRLIIFHPEAAGEADDGYAYYAERDPDVADRFRHALRSTIRRIGERPETYARVDDEVRRCLVPKFPYGVLYEVVDDETIFVVAVMHLKRKPGYWKPRR